MELDPKERKPASFASLAPADLLPLLFQHLDTLDALVFSHTCRSIKAEFARLFRLSARNTLSPFLYDIETFFDLLDLHRGVLSGSLVVRILQREPATASYATSDMDCYVPNKAGKCIVDYLVTYEGS